MSGDGAWAFAQEFYARPGVAAQLLRLQDEHGVDIPLVLVLLDTARRGATLDGTAVAELARASTQWHEEVVFPLRQARRSLKGLSADRHGELYARIKSVELSAEELIIRQLAAALPPVGPSSPPAAADANLEAYRRMLGLASDLFLPVEAAFAAEAG